MSVILVLPFSYLFLLNANSKFIVNRKAAFMEDINEEVLSVLSEGLRRINIPPDYQDTEPVNQQINFLINHLRARIQDWLDNDFTHLLNLMYRLDIGEQSFNDALVAPNPSKKLAELVLQREIQKARTRLAFQKKK